MYPSPNLNSISNRITAPQVPDSNSIHFLSHQIYPLNLTLMFTKPVHLFRPLCIRIYPFKIYVLDIHNLIFIDITYSFILLQWIVIRHYICDIYVYHVYDIYISILITIIYFYWIYIPQSLSSVPWYGHPTVCLSSHQLKDILVVSSFQWILINQYNIHVCLFLWTSFHFSWELK